MARELFHAEPVFADTVTRCADAVSGILPRPLLEVLFATDRETGGEAGETLRHTSFAQPALFAVEMGLARLWQSWGVEPDVVLGHSVGQYAAACVAGVFGLEDGARLMAERGRLFGSLPAGGRMVAVFADPKYVEEIANEFARVSVAGYNGPSVVLSGPGEDLEQIVGRIGGDGIRCSWLETSHAFHSELLEPVLGEFESYAAQLQFAVPTLPLVCNRTGTVLTAETPLDAQYWRRHSRQPVQFAESARTVAALGCSVLMEIGPQPVLTGLRYRSGRNIWRCRVRLFPCARASVTGARSPKRWPRPTSAAIGPSSRRCITSLAADSNCPPIRSSAVASGRRLPASPASMVRAPQHPE